MTEQNVKEAAHDHGGKGGDAAPQVRKKEGGLAGKFKEAAKWIVLGVAGFFLNEGLTWAKDKQLGGDDQLQKIAEQQKTEFAALKESLGKQQDLRWRPRQLQEGVRLDRQHPGAEPRPDPHDRRWPARRTSAPASWRARIWGSTAATTSS